MSIGRLDLRTLQSCSYVVFLCNFVGLHLGLKRLLVYFDYKK